MVRDEKKSVVNIQGDKLRAHIDAVLRTEAGRAVFAYLFRACGYNVSSIVINRVTGEIAPLSTECKEAQRLIYINLRQLASRELLAAAEELAEVPVSITPNSEEEKNK